MIERLKPRRIDIDDDDDDDNEPTEPKTFVVKRQPHNRYMRPRFYVTGGQLSIELFDCDVEDTCAALRVTIEPVKSKRERRREALRAWFSGSARERFSREDDMLDMLDAIDAEDP